MRLGGCEKNIFDVKKKEQRHREREKVYFVEGKKLTYTQSVLDIFAFQYQVRKKLFGREKKCALKATGYL